MKKSLFALAALLLAAAAPVRAADAPVLNADFKDFVQMPKGLYIGEAAGVAVNSKGHVYVFSRGNTTGPVYGSIASQLLEFDASGKYIGEIGHNLYGFGFAHTVRVDKDDNIWTTDKGTDMVVKFSPAGKVLMVFGRKVEAADYGTGGIQRVNPPRPPVPGMFRQVTDITWDPEGNSYVSDGYINSRVAKFDKDGNIVGSFGEPGTGPGQFNTPHTIAADTKGNIYVGDRGNGRIQVFDRDGKFEHMITQMNDVTLPSVIHAIRQPPAAGATVTNHTISPGAPWAICISPPNKAGEQFLFSSDSYPGRIYKMKLDGTVVGTIGSSGKTLGHFGDIHELACPDENTIFAAEELNWRVQKITIRPGTATVTN
ncbi:MAG TPA: peptidyl-alpha-hydroxyglycine alpha-amidating lyase family protein [Rhizomicrobium sp.]|nr:peptidyl-alpha-hydroxyglycine alpha-amidating lyase family protein [Rhizomicrobium sp.]